MESIFRDEILQALWLALSRFEENAEFVGLIPQVGTNMVYSRPRVESLGEVVGLSGRVIQSLGRPKVCGEVVYGGSTHLGSAVLEAQRLDPRLRAAVNIRGLECIAEALREMGLEVVALPPVQSEGCPVTDHLREAGDVRDAYYHPGAFAVEPTTTIFAESPSRLLDILEGLSERV